MSDYNSDNISVVCLLSIAALVVAVFGLIFVGCSPVGRAAYNLNQYAVQKVDDATSYKTRKNVEDTCRSMIVNYNSDKLTYEQYKDDEDSDMRIVANKAKIRANSTASSYNEYVLKNSFVWSGNVPDDIEEELPYIE